MEKNNRFQIYQTVINYIQGVNEKNIEKLSKVFHTNVFKREIKNNSTIDLDYSGIINYFDEKHNKNTYDIEIKILDINNNVASVIIRHEYIDLLQMIKSDNEWRIVNILSYLNANFEKNICKTNFRIETEHFIVNYNEAEKECIGEILSLLESSYTRITRNLCKECNQKTTVKMCLDKSELHFELGIKNGPDWIRGGIASGKTVIASPLNPPPGSNFYNVVNTVVHEFVHVIINEINMNIPRWLNEGIASYESKDNNENWIKNTVSEGVKNNNIPTLKDLDTGEDYEKFFNIDGYQYSYTIVEFIIKEFGYTELKKLVENPANYIEIFEMTENEFQCKWIEYLKINY